MYNKEIVILKGQKKMNEPDKLLLDFSALSITAGAFFQLLPSITALASLIWVCIRIYETETVKKLFGKQ